MKRFASRRGLGLARFPVGQRRDAVRFDCLG